MHAIQDGDGVDLAKVVSHRERPGGNQRHARRRNTQIIRLRQSGMNAGEKRQHDA